jgi:hypothetical protein
VYWCLMVEVVFFRIVTVDCWLFCDGFVIVWCCDLWCFDSVTDGGLIVVLLLVLCVYGLVLIIWLWLLVILRCGFVILGFLFLVVMIMVLWLEEQN